MYVCNACMHVCMYACMYVGMHACIHACMYVFPAKKTRFSSVFAKRTSKNIEFFPDFRQKDAGSPSQQKSRQGESSLGPLFCDTGSPKTTFTGTSSNCRAVRGGPPPLPPQKTYVIDVGRGGGQGGGYPQSSSKYPTRRAMSADIGEAMHQIMPNSLFEGSHLGLLHQGCNAGKSIKEGAQLLPECCDLAASVLYW